MPPTIEYSYEAIDYLDALPADVSDYIRRVVSTLPVVGRYQTVVESYTLELPDHIYRRMKLKPAPGYRIIFHLAPHNGVYVEKIARRDQNPYNDYA